MLLHIVTTNEPNYYCIDLELGILCGIRQLVFIQIYILFRRENNDIY